MPEVEIIKSMLIASISAGVTLLFAGIIWFLRVAYQKHVDEEVALQKIEIIIINNITSLQNNLGFIRQWIEALKDGTQFRAFLDDYIVEEDAILNLSKPELINEMLNINYRLKRMNLDMKNLEQFYKEVLPGIRHKSDPTQSAANLVIFFKKIIDELNAVLTRYDTLEEQLIKSLAVVRIIMEIRNHSLFGYLRFFSVDIFPRISDKKIAIKINEIHKNMKMKKLNGIVVRYL